MPIRGERMMNAEDVALPRGRSTDHECMPANVIDASLSECTAGLLLVFPVFVATEEDDFAMVPGAPLRAAYACEAPP